MGFILSRILSILIVLCLLFSSYLFSKHYKQIPKAIKWVGFLILINLIVEVSSLVLAKLWISNLFLLHYYVPFKVLFLGLFFMPIFKYPKQDYRQILVLVMALVIGFSIFNTIYYQSLDQINSYAYTLANMFIIVCASISFFRLTTAEDVQKSYRHFLRRILPPLFIYECTSLFIFMFGVYLQVIDMENQRHLWIANAFFNLILQIFVILAFVRLLESPTPPISEKTN